MGVPPVSASGFVVSQVALYYNMDFSSSILAAGNLEAILG
jgi:hypothetical protein